ncbi:Ribonuclease H-like protein [Dioscorea alata]|uniref:Ribonuclease H-like protein n=1 Tax=Dioscorea alata TaxID=55571 RepID=A0ACB7UD69_DIOAL|nr:Ribonuclease H-like protein [Dioscorea alata]
MSNEMGASSGHVRNKKDPTWKYNFLSDPNDPNTVTYMFCPKITKGRIFRAKQHQIGNFRNAKSCLKVLEHPKKVVELKNHWKLKQVNITDAWIPFNVAKLDSFKWAIEAIGQYGPNLKPPSYHELRVTLLQKKMDYTIELFNHKEAWVKYVNCPAGTMFVMSIDVSAYVKIGEKRFELLDSFVDYIGEANVFQVIIDNARNFVMAEKRLGKLPLISKTLERAIALTGFIRNHTNVLNMMRQFTNQRDLVRPTKTRFCTCYLTLQSVHKKKVNLRTMFTSQERTTSKWTKNQMAKRNSVVFTLKAMGPLVQAMDRAKETIIESFGENEGKYKDIFKIVDKRWECQLHHPLHAAGYFLNLEFFYDNQNIEFDEEITSGLYAYKIMSELHMYKNAEGLFGIPLAIRSRKTKALAEWWNLYGTSTPNVQQLAIKILSLTCSASGCERNWSVFQHAIYVKYNQKLKERYDGKKVVDPISLGDIDDSNEWLTGKMGANLDEAEDDLVFEDDELTWGVVASATAVKEEDDNEVEHDVDGYDSEQGKEDENMNLEFAINDDDY